MGADRRVFGLKAALIGFIAGYVLAVAQRARVRSAPDGVSRLMQSHINLMEFTQRSKRASDDKGKS